MGIAVFSVYVFLVRPAFDDGSAWNPATIDIEPYPAPELALSSTGGDPVRLEDFRGDVVLVFFGFSNCPDVCPATLLHWSRALEELEARGVGFRGIFVSVDPDRDTPEALDRWMENFHPSIIAATGSPEELERAAADWGVYVQSHADGSGGSHDAHESHEPEAGPLGSGVAEDANDLPPNHQHHEGEGPDDYMIEHSTRTFVVDADGRIVRLLQPYLDEGPMVEALDPFLGG